ncbi:hypothetical protein HDV00_008490 [Rhizophlyctis rosea]|nr:hypothetical protein HDV00_008490 [Rhizophlyctis rosea]
MELLRKEEEKTIELQTALAAAVKESQDIGKTLQMSQAVIEDLRRENERLRGLGTPLQGEAAGHGDTAERNLFHEPEGMDIEHDGTDDEESDEILQRRKEKGKAVAVGPENTNNAGGVEEELQRNVDRIDDSDGSESDSDSDESDDPEDDDYVVEGEDDKNTVLSGDDGADGLTADAARKRDRIKELAQDVANYKLVARCLNHKGAIGKDNAVSCRVLERTFSKLLYLRLRSVSDAARMATKTLPDVVIKPAKNSFYLSEKYGGDALCQHKKLKDMKELYTLFHTPATLVTPSTPPSKPIIPPLVAIGSPAGRVRPLTSTTITYTRFISPEDERPRFLALAKVLGTGGTLLHHAELSIREIIADSLPHIDPKILLEYTAPYRQNGLGFATPELAKNLAPLLSKSELIHAERAQCLGELLRSRNLPTFVDDQTNSAIDVGIICRHLEATCHYIEHDRFGRMLYARITGPMTRDEFRAVQIPFENIAHLDPDDERQFVLLVSENRKAYLVADINGITMFGSQYAHEAIDSIRTHVGKDRDPFSSSHTVKLQPLKVNAAAPPGPTGATVTPPVAGSTANASQMPTAAGSGRTSTQPGGTQPNRRPSPFVAPLPNPQKRDADTMSQLSRTSKQDDDTISEDSRASKRSRTSSSQSSPTSQELYQQHVKDRSNANKPVLSWESFLEQVSVIYQLKNRKECKIPSHPKPVVMNQAAITDAVYRLSGANRLWVSRADISDYLRKHRREFNPVLVCWNELDLTRPIYYTKTLKDPESVMGKACRGMENSGLLEIHQESSGERLMFRLTPHVAKALETGVIEFSFANLALPRQPRCVF